jgi:CBS domain-containing protein
MRCTPILEVVMKVSEIMTRNPVCCYPSSSTLSATLLMQETDTGIVPVIQDPFTPILVGVVTDRDLCLHVVAAGRDPASTWISGCMTEGPVCCTEQDDVSHALDLMKTHQIRRLPVVNEKHEVAGMLSLSDLVCKAGIEATAIAATLRSICEPAHGAKQRIERIFRAA